MAGSKRCAGSIPFSTSGRRPFSRLPELESDRAADRSGARSHAGLWRFTGPSDTTREADWEKCSPPDKRSWAGWWRSNGSGLRRLHEDARKRFLREAEITAGLQHPGIVPIYGLGQDDDGPFYTMPLIDGQTLQEAIEEFHGDESLSRDSGQGSLRFRELLQKFMTVCDTVAYAHDQGVVHRDLKPSNIMLGRYGETLVMDWGLAKHFGTEDPDGETGESTRPSPSPSPDALTATGAVLGTPQYMSPEQAKGLPTGPGQRHLQPWAHPVRDPDGRPCL